MKGELILKEDVLLSFITQARERAITRNGQDHTSSTLWTARWLGQENGLLHADICSLTSQKKADSCANCH